MQKGNPKDLAWEIQMNNLNVFYGQYLPLNEVSGIVI